MKLSEMLGRWKKRRQSESPEKQEHPAQAGQESASAEPGPAAATEAPSDERAPVSQPAGGSGQPERESSGMPGTEVAGGNLDDVVQTVQTIRELLGDQEEEAGGGRDFIEIPADALIDRIPAEARGPAWAEVRESAQQHRVVVDRDTLIEQLRQGRIVLPVQVFSGQLPPGVFADGVDPDMEVELDLPRVVASVPPELLVPEEQIEEEMAVGEDLFTPKTAPASVVEEEEAAMVGDGVPAAESEEAGVSEVPAGAAAGPEAGPPVAPAPAVEEESRETAGEMVPSAAVPESEAVEEPVAAEPRGETAPAETEEVAAVLPEAQEQVGAEGAAPQAPAEQPEPVVAAAETIEEEVPEVEEEAILPPPEELAASAGLVEEDRVPAPVVPPPGRAPAEGGWDGVESTLGAPAGVDVNSAGEEELTEVRGCGPARAAAIVRYRMEYGPFRSIYDLLNIPGIGPTTFAAMTGLSPRRRENRHRVLARLLNAEQETEAVVPMAVIPERLAGQFDAPGAVLANIEGLALAASGTLVDEADACAAWAVQFFRRTRRYLTPLGLEQDAQIVFLPAAARPLLLGFHGSVLVVLATRTSGLRKEYSKRFAAILRELAWRFGRRAVVRAL